MVLKYWERNMHLKALGLAAVTALAFAVPALAHHSHANYEQNEFIELDGTITQVMWMNMEVEKEDGTSGVWALEGGSVGALMRGGWQQDTLKVGDEVHVRCHHLKDGSDGCLLGYVSTPDGRITDKEFD
jgi:hypothetical protein